MRTIRPGVEVLVFVAILLSAACSTETASPAAPTNTPAATPAPGPSPLVASVQLAVTPNPVPFSGQPIPDVAGCAGLPNTWFYQQNFKENGGVAVTFTSRIDKFDGRANPVTTLNLVIPAMGATTLTTRWCSSQAVAHTAQSSFSGIDANGHAITLEGPRVDLQSP